MNEIHMISAQIEISNALTEKRIKKIIDKEVKFYDDSYFVKRTDPKIVVYYSGHALPKYLVLSQREVIYYDDYIMGHFAKSIENQMSVLKNVKEDKVIWGVNFYIDACHSGSCLDSCKKWVL